MFTLLSYTAAALSALLAVASLLRKRLTPAAWAFSAGMAALALDSLFTGFSLRAVSPADMAAWLTRGFLVKSLVPVVWLAFSLAYSRGNAREFLARWRIPLALAGLLPPGLALLFRDRLVEVAVASDGAWWLQFDAPAKALNVILLVALVLVLMNLEQTFRSAVGTMRWRIKFVVLALTVIFGAHIYVRSQAILFSAHDVALSVVEPGALLVGCAFFLLAYVRTGWAEIDIYPSRDVLRSSLTVLIAGGYLLIVGALGQLVRRFGGAEGLRFQSLVILIGMAGLGLLLLSDRFRQVVQQFVARHFRRAQHDSVRIWSLFSHRLADVRDQAGLCDAAARSIAESFDVLSVTVWVLDDSRGRLEVAASTAREARGDGLPDETSSAVPEALRTTCRPFDLEAADGAWVGEWRRLNPTEFPNGGDRWCVPMRSGDRLAGAIVLADRVNGARYSVEELELLQCIADQVTSVLLNLRFANEVARARELEAFRTMSTFFVHDLKNAAASLNLMLRNLPVHFDDPAFRQDALRAIGNTARRIDDTIARLSTLRQTPDFQPVPSDLNALVGEALARIGPTPGVELTTELAPLPAILADREQIRSVVTNLVLNARDAVVSRFAGPEGPASGCKMVEAELLDVAAQASSPVSHLQEAGALAPAQRHERPTLPRSSPRVAVTTTSHNGRAVLTVADNGCGMGPAFVKDSLFRPFQSTKKKGLGIGMFQSRMIVERHGGSIQVESEVGAGTTFHVSFPVPDEDR